MSRRTSTPRRGRSILAVVTGIACAFALAVAPASAARDGGSDGRPNALPRIKGSVGPGFEISINKASVPAGRYKLIVNDEGTIHNFHFLGEGVDKATSVPGTGKTVFRVRLRPGTYTASCDTHEAMTTSLTVT